MADRHLLAGYKQIKALCAKCCLKYARINVEKYARYAWLVVAAPFYDTALHVLCQRAAAAVYYSVVHLSLAASALPTNGSAVNSCRNNIKLQIAILSSGGDEPVRNGRNGYETVYVYLRAECENKLSCIQFLIRKIFIKKMRKYLQKKITIQIFQQFMAKRI